MIKNRFLDKQNSIRILKILTQRWTDMAAFKSGVIDSQGRVIVKPPHQTYAQKQSYTTLDLLVWNLRRMIEKVPMGKRSISKYLYALNLIKEENAQEFDTLMLHLHKYIKEQDMTLLIEEMGVANVTSGVDMADGAKKAKIEPDDTHSGNPVFDVEDEHFMKSRFGKRPFLKYSTYVGGNEQGEKIRTFARSNPNQSILIRQKSTGAMQYLRKK